MENNQSSYIILCTLFSTLLIIGNLTYQKFVCLTFLPFINLELSVGTILYPFTTLVTVIISEFYGKKRAQFCVKLAIGMNLTVARIILGMDQLETTNWSQIDNQAFHKAYGLFSISFMGSVIACYISQFFEIKIYLGIRKLTHGKTLWIVSTCSIAISLLIDTIIVIGILTTLNVYPAERMLSLVTNSYMFKLIFSLCSAPFFSIFSHILNRFDGQIVRNKNSYAMN